MAELPSGPHVGYAVGMSGRAADWFRQAEADLQHARHAWRDEHFEWACFAAQQAAEKAAKGVPVSQK